MNAEYGDAILLRAAINKFRHDFDTALRDLNKAISLNPKSINAYLSRADLYFLKNDYSHASMDFYKALDLDPNCSMAYAGLARIFKEKGNRAKQLALYQKAIEREPGNLWLYIERGASYLEFNENDKAIGDFTKVLSVNPLIEIARVGRAACYRKLGKYDLALSDLQETLKINPESTLALHKVGQIYYDTGKYHDAVHLFEKILAINVEFSPVYEDLWKACAKIGDIERARIHFVNALDVTSQNSGFYSGLILSARSLELFDLGVLATKKALEFEKDDFQGRYNALGYFYTQLGNLSLAEESLQKALQSKADLIYLEYVYINLGIVKWLQKSKSSAFEFFKKAEDKIFQQKKQLDKFGTQKKKTSIKKMFQNEINKEGYILAWIAIMRGQSNIGFSQILSWFDKFPSEYTALLDLRDWITAIKMSSDIPAGISELEQLVSEKLSTNNERNLSEP